MPRGKIKFSTSSPHSGQWPGDPEAAMAELARKNNATYVEGSLVFAPGGKFAEALFETVEPEPESTATRLHQLGIDLDAESVSLFIDRERWRQTRGPEEAG